MNQKSPLRALLGWTLKGQGETDLERASARAPTPERMDEALGGNPFNDDEKRALLRSPAGRMRLRFRAEARRAERLFRWHELAVDNSLALRAAAGGPIEPVSVGNEDFSLSVLPLDEQGTRWLLHLRISPRLRSELVGDRLTVRDDQGAIWLSGSPDAEGELSGLWALDEPPPELLAARRIFIDPV